MRGSGRLGSRGQANPRGGREIQTLGIRKRTSKMTDLSARAESDRFLFFEFYFILFYFLLFIYLTIHLWLCWVFASVQGPSLVVASGGHSSRCAGLSLSRPLLLRSTGSRRAGSAIVAHRPSRSAARGILPDQGSNPCPRIGRQTLNHCATREALIFYFLNLFIFYMAGSH